MKSFIVIILLLIELSCSLPTKLVQQNEKRLNQLYQLKQQTNESRDTYIVDGQVSKIGEVPYIASLQALVTDGIKDWMSHICGASILNRRTIITAAHCFNSYKAGIPVEYLQLRYNTIFNNTAGHLAKVSEVIIHENYDRDTFESDIAIIITDAPLILNEDEVFSAKPVTLPRPGDDLIMSNVRISGWGYQKEESNEISAKLMTQMIPAVDRETCRRAYAPKHITDEMICAGLNKGGVDTCQGDSGGPLTIGRELVGIVSFGRGCARPGIPGVYTRVASYIDWINLHKVE